MSRLPFNAMQVIEAVVRLGSFSAAARELGLTDSAISNSVRRFESDLDQTLFERHAGRVEPRPAAHRIAAATSQASYLLRGALDELTDPASVPTITLACTPTFATRWLASRMPGLRAAVAPVRITMSSGVALTDEADLWVRHGSIEGGDDRWPGLTALLLMPDVKQPVAAPSLIGDGPVSDLEVSRYPLIAVAARPDEWPAWFAAASLGAAPDPVARFDVTANAWDAARAGTGIALGNPTLLADDLASGDLHALSDTRLQTHAYYLCRRRGDRRSYIRQAWRWFREA